MTPQREVLFEPFPKQQEFLDACFSGNYSFVVYGGAIRGGKTFCVLALFILLSRIFPGSRWAIIRKDLPTIESNLYPSWNKIKPKSFLLDPEHDPHGRTHISTFKNGSQIIFFPESIKTDKDHDRWKGFEVNGFGFEEINECQPTTLSKAFERAGSYVIPGLETQPKPLVVATCNPTQGWFKELVYTPWKENRIKPTWKYIQSKIYDNIPLLTQQPDYLPNLKENLSIYEYMVFVDGDWDVQLKTGGEFLRSFELSKHVRPATVDPDNLIRISIDSNVYPYIAVTAWQLVKKEAGGWIIRQVAELQAADPNNTASKAAEGVVRWLREIGYTQRIILHGDRSTKARNNIDDNKRSFYQIVDETIRNAGFRTEDGMGTYAPPVASIADFVNAIFEGKVKDLEIEIGEHCKVSINDYIATKTDKDGTMLKVRKPHPTIPGLTYEENGHLTDTLKDLIVQAFNKEYVAYVNRHKQPVPGGIGIISRKPGWTP